MDSLRKSLQTLELPAVLALLAAQAVSETAARRPWPCVRAATAPWWRPASARRAPPHR